MAAVGLARLLRTQIKLVKPALSVTCVRNHWNKDYKPGPYPKTEAERVAAAKKYGLLREDYEPYPEDDYGYGFGDYPKLPVIPADQRDPYRDWDYYDFKRNYGEPLHVYDDAYGHDRISGERRRLKYWQYSSIFFGVIFSIFALAYYFDTHFTRKQNVLPKQYPGPGQVHYTFEPAD